MSCHRTRRENRTYSPREYLLSSFNIRIVKFGEEFITAPDNISNDDNSEKVNT